MDILLIASCALAAALMAGGVVWLFRGQRIAVLLTETLALRSQLAELRQRAERESAELVEARKRIFDLGREGASLRTDLERSAESHDDQVRQLTALRQEFQDQFKVLAGDVLRTSNEDFAKRADEIFKAQKDLTAAEIDKRTKTIEDLLTPIGKSLEAYDTAIKDIEKSRIEGFAGIHQALQSVNSQHAEVTKVTAGLVNALRASPKTRGRWGEETLRRVMELSGMVEHCDFQTETHFRGDDESLRPDVLIKVAGGRTIIVDAKAPVSAYLDALNAATEDERETLLRKHARELRERLTNLSSKSYWEKIAGSTDCVVMFVPGDNFVSAAFERDPDLFEDGVKNRVLVCTPTTFIALAKAISYGWRQEKLTANAMDVARLGKDLYARLSTFGDHMGELGKHINQAARKYNAVVGSLESTVMPQARRFHEMGVEGTAEPINRLAEIDTVVRFPQPGRDLLVTRVAE